MDENRLKDHIRYTLNTYLTPVDEEKVWQAIEAKRKKKKRPVLLYRFLYGVLLLGAIAAGSLGWSFINQARLDQALADQQTPAAALMTDGLCLENNKVPMSSETITTSTRGHQNKTVIKDQLNAGTNLSVQTAAAKQLKSSATYSTTRAITTIMEKAPLAVKSSAPLVEQEPLETAAISTQTAVGDKTINELDFLPIKWQELKYARAIELRPDLYDSETENEEEQDVSTTDPWQLQAIIGTAYGLNNKSLKAENNTAQSYLQDREATEKTLDHFKFNIGAALQHQSGVYAQLEAEYLQFTERYNALLQSTNSYKAPDQLVAIIIGADGSTTEIRDSALVTDITSSERKKYNRFKFVDLNLQLGYHLVSSSKWRVSIEGGMALNMYSSQSGEIVDEAYQAYDLSADSNDWWKTRNGIAVLGKIALAYNLSDNLAVYLAPSVKHYLNPITTTNYVLQQKFTAFSLATGVRYSFGK